MKYILSILIFCSIFMEAKSQGQPYPQSNGLGAGSATTLYRQLGAIIGEKGIITAVYPDTTTANAGYIDFYPGAIIGTQANPTDSLFVWMRNINSTRWVKINVSGGGGHSGIDSAAYRNIIQVNDSTFTIFSYMDTSTITIRHANNGGGGSAGCDTCYSHFNQIDTESGELVKGNGNKDTMYFPTPKDTVAVAQWVDSSLNAVITKFRKLNTGTETLDTILFVGGGGSSGVIGIDSLRISGVNIQAHKNGNWVTQYPNYFKADTGVSIIANTIGTVSVPNRFRAVDIIINNAMRIRGDTAYTNIGYDAGSTAYKQTAVGGTAGRNNTGASQTAVGFGAGGNNTGTSQTAVGTNAGLGNTGASQTAVGINAGLGNTGTSQTAVGSNAGLGNAGKYTIAIGDSSGYNNTYDNVITIGRKARADSTNQMVFRVNDNLTTRFSFANISTPQKYYLPNKTGTLALLSDITGGGGGIQPSDTATMLAPYLRKVDTATLSARIDNVAPTLYGEAAYGGTIAWNGTAPSGTTAHRYIAQKMGNFVNLIIRFSYSVDGSGLTAVTFTLPSGVPAPLAMSGMSLGSGEVWYPANGVLMRSTNAVTTVSRAYMFSDSGTLKIKMEFGSATLSYGFVQICYPTLN